MQGEDQVAGTYLVFKDLQSNIEWEKKETLKIFQLYWQRLHTQRSPTLSTNEMTSLTKLQRFLMDQFQKRLHIQGISHSLVPCMQVDDSFMKFPDAPTFKRLPVYWRVDTCKIMIALKPGEHREGGFMSAQSFTREILHCETG